MRQPRQGRRARADRHRSPFLWATLTSPINVVASLPEVGPRLLTAPSSPTPCHVADLSRRGAPLHAVGIFGRPGRSIPHRTNRSSSLAADSRFQPPDPGSIDHVQCEGRQTAAGSFAHGLATRHACRHRRRHVERLRAARGCSRRGRELPHRLRREGYRDLEHGPLPRFVQRDPWVIRSPGCRRAPDRSERSAIDDVEAPEIESGHRGRSIVLR